MTFYKYSAKHWVTAGQLKAVWVFNSCLWWFSYTDEWSYLRQHVCSCPARTEAASGKGECREAHVADELSIWQGACLLKEELGMDVGYYETADVKGTKQRVAMEGIRHERVMARRRSSKALKWNYITQMLTKSSWVARTASSQACFLPYMRHPFEMCLMARGCDSFSCSSFVSSCCEFCA